MSGRSDVAAGRQEVPGRALRRLQLCLAALWLVDAMLQGQAFMFSRGFAAMLAATAHGSPAAVAGPGTWSAGLIAAHPVATNAAFLAVQLLLALGIAWRPAVRAALAASVVWSLAVWWLGEGLGGMLAGGANPVTGAPGAVLLYAMLAIVLWPPVREAADHDAADAGVPDRTAPDRAVPGRRAAGRRAAGRRGPDSKTPVQAVARRPTASFPAATAIGAPGARAAWLVLWSGLAVLAALSGGQAPHALAATIAVQSAGQPRWLAAVDGAAAGLAARHSIGVTCVLTALLVIVAIGVFLPLPAARACLGVAVAVALVSWVAGQDMGGIFTGAGTDPSTGPLLALLAAAYWPASPASQDAARLPGGGRAPQPGKSGGSAAGRCRQTSRPASASWTVADRDRGRPAGRRRSRTSQCGQPAGRRPPTIAERTT
jgi:hypothetical protein